MKFKNILLTLSSIVSITTAATPIVVAASQPISQSVILAQGSASSQVSEGTSSGFVPCGNTKENPCTIAHLFAGFVVIINYLIAAAGFIAVAMIVYAGLRMVLARGNESELTSAKGRPTGAIIGIVLVSSAYVLINSLIAGSFGLGVKDGALILTNPREYIQRASIITAPGDATKTDNKNTPPSTQKPPATQGGQKR